MQTVRNAVADDIEILPVTVVVREFPARPSAVPNIRDFVREELARTPLSSEDIRTIGERVADILLDAAGPGGAIQVLLRIFGDQAEVDLLQINHSEAAGDTGVIP